MICIAPSVIDTPLLRSVMAAEADAAYCVNVPLGPVESPQDVAAVAAVISSSEASDITGSCIDVNGGIRMQRHIGKWFHRYRR